MTSGKLVAVVDSARAGAFRSALEDQPRGGGTSSGLTNEQLLLLFNAYEAITTEEEIENIHTGGTDGPLIITCSDGSTQENNYPAQYPIIVADSEGNQYLVDEGGEATLITPDMVAAAEAERGTGATAQAVNNVDSVIALLSPVRFAPAEGMKFGYDSLKYEGLTNQYDPQQILDNSVRVPFKAVASGQTDFLKALLPANEHMNDSAISFVYNGTPVTGAETGDGNKKLTLSALSTGTSMPLEVYYNLLDTAGNTHQELIGQVNLVGYERQEIKLVIVPVKILRPDNNNIEAPVVDEASISTHLNDKVYSQAVTSWNITTHEVLEVETEGAFDNDDPDNRMDYTGGMKDVYREFKDQFDRDNDAVYVFLIPGETEDGGLKGYMPLKGQYAFIFMNNIGTGTVENTIAHEIAHGTFNLRHTFSTENAYVLPENSTDNLMDYREGSELSKFQWDFIHNPESVLFAWLEDEEEGEISLPCIGWFDDCDDVLQVLETIKNAKLNGNKVKLKKDTNTEEHILIANSVNVGGTDYNRIRLIYKPQLTDYLFIPTDYKDYEKHFMMEGTTDVQEGFAYYSGNDAIFKILVDDDDEKILNLKDYLFGQEEETIPENDRKIIIKINRIRNNEFRSVGTINIDNGAIEGYVLELPKGTESECQSVCTDEKKIENECSRILEGNYTFEITAWSNNPEFIDKSLRINNVPGRSGILIHRGVNARIWSYGCILGMRNNPSSDQDNSSADERANLINDSEAFCIEIVEYVKQRIIEIKEEFDLEKVEMIIIINNDNEINE